MHRNSLIASAALACISAAPAVAQHAQNSPVAVDPTNANRVWVCNRDNDSVSVVDVTAGSVVAEIPVGVWPRSIAFSADGSKAFVANQRGNVPVNVNFATPFAGSEVRGSVSVINTSALAVANTLTNVGTEPYGVAVAPNGKYFAVTAFRSATVKLFSTSTNALLATVAFDANMNFIPSGKTIADVDANKDFFADLCEPRDLVIQSNSARIFVAHNTSPYVSVLNVFLDGSGNPTGAALNKKIDLNTYAYDNIFNPTPVTAVQSQGRPRFLANMALSPDGSRLFVPHVLHNINHDVNHDFGGAIAGAFANRVYPSISVVDANTLSFNQGGDNSARAHNELTDPLTPAQYVPFGSRGTATQNGFASFGGTVAPTLGANVTFTMRGGKPGDIGFLWYGAELNLPLPPMGTLYANPTVLLGFPNLGASFAKTIAVPNDNNLVGQALPMQAAIVELPSGNVALSNGLKTVFGTQGPGSGKLGLRPGHPQQVAFSASGSRMLLMNRGSEDLFLYKVTGSSMELMTAYPPRFGHVDRTPFDATSPIGDLPLGMAIKEDASTSNDDALVYVVNEGNRTLSRLRVDWTTGAITKEGAQIPTLTGADLMTQSQKIGQELFEDASRAQTAGNFNNSCATCHFEGNADANVWQRPAGPRSTMPVFGGTLATGLILWKGVRLNMGETGPMFGGENGGTGVLTDTEQQGLTDYHEVIPVPLNPNLDPTTGQLTATAALGRDLFFGSNDTGLNPTGRKAGCATCHPLSDPSSFVPLAFTIDYLNPTLTSGENLESYDPYCFPLVENIVGTNIRNVNSGVNTDFDDDLIPEVDRNFDGYSDLESYTPMNRDLDDDFTRDDANSYQCPDDPFGPPLPLKLFTRSEGKFSIPTKLGVFTTGPYFHDHVASSLRMILDPIAQWTDPKYGDPTYPRMQKFFNEFHDVRGHQEFAPSSSKVQLNLQSTNVDADIDALLSFIQSL